MIRLAIRGWSLAAAITLLLTPTMVHAQTATGTDTAFDAQLYWPMAGPSEHVFTRNSSVSPSGAVGFGLIANYMQNPLRLTPIGSTQAVHAIDWAVTTDFVWNVGILNRFQLSIGIPVVVQQSGEGTVPIRGRNGAVLSDTALRDLRVEASWAIVQRNRIHDATGFGLRLDVGAVIPFGDEKGFNSQGGFTFAPMLVADVRTRMLTFSLNAGARIRETRHFADVTLGTALVGALGVALRPTPTSRFTVSLDGHLVKYLPTLTGTISPTNLEAALGFRYATDASRDIELLAAFAVGPVNDPLTPAMRAIVGISYAPRGNDTDGDGVVDASDRCIAEREDMDDFEDEDGCPETDNDNDTVLDANDHCPNEPEDADNHEDGDGCPDTDNDGDTILDDEDECPNNASGDHPDTSHNGCPLPDTDGDGVFDNDDRCVDTAAGTRPDPARAGCPIPDDDGDGIINADDACPTVPSGNNADRWRPGCPDNDADRDGVMGEADRCPEQPETINGVQDSDGCPDTGASLANWDTSNVDVIRFARSVVVAPRAQSLAPATVTLVVQAAQRIRGRGNEVGRVIVEVMPGVGATAQAEAVRQGEVVRDVLLAQRIPARNVVVQAATRPTPSRPVAGRPGARVLPAVAGTVLLRIERRPEPASSR
jgi:OmpA-OmpF porin, OOP family